MSSTILPPDTILHAAQDLADLIADDWDGAELWAWLLSRTTTASEEVRRLAHGLAPIREALGGGGWFPVSDCVLSVDDLHALHRAGIFKAPPELSAGSWGLDFEPAWKLRGFQSARAADRRCTLLSALQNAGVTPNPKGREVVSAIDAEPFGHQNPSGAVAWVGHVAGGYVAFGSWDPDHGWSVEVQMALEIGSLARADQAVSHE